MRLGIIGAGTVGKIHAAAALAAGVEVVYIVDADKKQADALASEHLAAKSSTDTDTLLGSAEVDSVVIAVPNCYHKALAIAAMNAGKDVLLEKPMGLNREECAAINQVASETGRILQIGMANRFTAVGQAAKQVTDSGDLGSIYHAKANLYMRRGIPGLGGWFTTKALSGGGVLIDNGVHLVDLVLWLLGFPQVNRVSGKVYSEFGSPIKDYVYESMWGGPPRMEGTCDVEESAHALIRLDGGRTIELNVAWAMNVPSSMESGTVGLFGDRGGLNFQLYGDHVQVATSRYGKNIDTHVRLAQIDAFQEQMKSFAFCVQSREQPLASGTQGEFVSSVLDAIYKSSETDCEVTISD